jgi:hypothetical protein
MVVAEIVLSALLVGAGAYVLVFDGGDALA